jgi:predicted amidohydrolase
MLDCRIALAQCRPTATEPLEENLSRMDDATKRAAAAGADLVAFPESMLTGHLRDRAAVEQRAVPLDAPAVTEAVALARRHAIHLAFGLLEREADRCFNTCVLAGPDGRIGTQRKVHLPARERGTIAAGNAFRVFRLPFAVVGIGICYDNEIAETHAVLAVLGAELILMPAAWSDHWEREAYIEPCATDDDVVRERTRWTRMMFGARCRDTGTYSALVNQAGPEAGGPWRFVGKSAVFAPTGRVVAEAGPWEEELLTADLQADLLHAYRAMPSFAMHGRRPTAYAPLVRDRKEAP